MQKSLIVVTAFASLFLVFLAGAVTTYFELFPFPLFRDAFIAAEALSRDPKTNNSNDYYLGAKAFEPEDAETPAIRWEEPGVFHYDREQALNGYTIYSPIRGDFPLRLIDMQGNTIWQWEINWNALSGPRLDGLGIEINSDLAQQRVIGLGEPTLFPNGDLLLVLNTAWYTPWGLALIKVDKHGEPIWKYTRQVHHEISLGPDNEIYALTHGVVNEPWPGLESIDTPFVDDHIVVLSPDGEEKQSISILQAIQNSGYAALLMYADPGHPKGDLLHVNSIDYLDADEAHHIPNALPGNVLISMRNSDVIAVIDLQTVTVRWAVRGYWRLQHDAALLPNGHIILFDNRGDLKNGGTSRVIEIDPKTREIVWEYPGRNKPRLYTSVLGSQERLPNGNTLISESNNGQLIEVNAQGDIVWLYRVPEVVEKKDGRRLANAIFAKRFLPGELPFIAGKTPGDLR